MGSDWRTVGGTGSALRSKMASLTLAAVMLVVTPLVTPAPQLQSFGASAPAPCCRSNFPEEFGSCQTNQHCPQPTAPFSSAFGYCTQIHRYGYDGCVACHQYSSTNPQYQK